MVGKKGFIRTMEAVIAILLVLGFLLYILPRTPVLAESSIPEGIESARSFILMEFLTNKKIRECVNSVSIAPIAGSNGFDCLKAPYANSDCVSIIEEFLDRHLVPGFEYHCEVCNKVGPCTGLPSKTIEKSVYPGAIFIYFSDNVKYVRVYFWRK